MRLGERIYRGVWRGWLRLRHLASHRRGGEAGVPVIEHVAGMALVVLPSVFNPRLFRSGAFLAESLREDLVPRGSRVLDLGTGAGGGAIVAARWARSVVACDINEDAARAARINAALNRVEDRVEVREGDLFEPLRLGVERFDVVIFNPPYYRGDPGDVRDRAWRSPDLDRRFAEGLAAYLEPAGCALLCLSTDGDLDFVSHLESAGYDVDVVAERDLVNEVLRLHRARKRGRG